MARSSATSFSARRPPPSGTGATLLVAALGGLLAFALGHQLDRLAGPLTGLDAVGLSLFAVNGAAKALEFGLGPAQAIILGAVTAVGGRTLRDVLVLQVPTVLHSDLYAVPALVAAALTVAAVAAAVYGAVAAAAACFVLRMLGVRYGPQVPRPPGVG